MHAPLQTDVAERSGSCLVRSECRSKHTLVYCCHLPAGAEIAAGGRSAWGLLQRDLLGYAYNVATPGLLKCAITIDSFDVIEVCSK